jgi:uncharacterized membrane protein
MIQYDIPCHNDLRHSNGIKQNRSSIKVWSSYTAVALLIIHVS